MKENSVICTLQAVPGQSLNHIIVQNNFSTTAQQSCQFSCPGHRSSWLKYCRHRCRISRIFVSSSIQAAPAWEVHAFSDGDVLFGQCLSYWCSVLEGFLVSAKPGTLFNSSIYLPSSQSDGQWPLLAFTAPFRVPFPVSKGNEEWAHNEFQWHIFLPKWSNADASYLLVMHSQVNYRSWALPWKSERPCRSM